MQHRSVRFEGRLWSFWGVFGGVTAAIMMAACQLRRARYCNGWLRSPSPGKRDREVPVLIEKLGQHPLRLLRVS
ncbi:hypothetical protein BD769DRAFT_135196 [Suillus cothurnatus]|nr:hypothetical protein BD769DRAFT_135196 [Suillus cothurnatus]